MKKRLVIFLASLSLASFMSHASGVKEIQTCMTNNLPDSSSKQRFHIVANDRSGSKRTLGGSAYSLSDPAGMKMTLVLDTPPDLSGSAYLNLYKNDKPQTYMYVPSFNKVKRIKGKSLKGKLWGTDISYGDFQYLQSLRDDLNTTLIGEEEISARQAWKLESINTASIEGAYAKVLLWVDKESCLVLKSELFDTQQKLSKRITNNIEAIKQLADRWISEQYLIEDILANTSTRITLTNIRYDKKLGKQVFSPRSFYLSH